MAQRDQKECILESLGKALEEGKVDEGIIDLLRLINSHPDLVTTSSCSGRVQIILVDAPGDKCGSRVMRKWHGTPGPEEMENAYRSWDGRGHLMVMAQPLLLHVRARDLDTGIRFRNVSQNAGLKHSTIRSLRLVRGRVPEWGVTVEALGTERMEFPLNLLGSSPDRNVFRGISEHCGTLINRTKSHIPRLKERFRTEFSEGLGPDHPVRTVDIGTKD